MARRTARRNDAFITNQTPMARRAGEALAAVTAAGRELYRRERDLPRLARATPAEIADQSLAMRRVLLARLARALRAERNRGRAGHWTYDLNRHIALRQAFEAEKAACRRAAASSQVGKTVSPAGRDG